MQSPYKFKAEQRQGKPPTGSVELCCTSADIHAQKWTYNSSFVPATLSACTFQITVHDPVSHIQNTEWNSTTISKWSNPKLYISDKATIWVLFIFDDINKPYNNVRREILPSISSQAVE